MLYRDSPRQAGGLRLVPVTSINCNLHCNVRLASKLLQLGTIPHESTRVRKALAVVMKNCEPLVLGPPLAIAMRPLSVNFMRKFWRPCQLIVILSLA